MEIIRGLFAYLGMMMWIIWIGTEDIMDWILGKTNHTEHAVYSQSMHCSCKSSHQVREMMIEPWEDWDVRSRYEAMMHL